MFNNGIAGSGVYDTSVRFRMYLIVVVGIFALGSVLFWRSQALLASDYVEFPKHEFAKSINNQINLDASEETNN